MRKSAFIKDIRRTFTNNLSRFISITVMATLGIGVFSGFAMGCIDTLKSADRFYDAQSTYDIQIVSTLGLNRDDIAAVSGLDGVGAVFGSRSMDVKIELAEGNSKPATLSTLDPNGMNKPQVLEGKLPEKSGQIAVSSKFIEDTGLHLGDTITLSEKAAAEDTKADESDDKGNTDLGITIKSDSAEPSLAVQKYEITAVVLSPLDISAGKGISAISDSSGSSYMMFSTADCISGEIYTAIYLTVNGASRLDCYSSKYEALVDTVISRIKATTLENRQKARYDEIVGSTGDKISDAERQLLDKDREAQEKLSDSQAEIDKGLAELNDGQAKLDSQKEAALEQFTSGERLLAQSRNELSGQKATVNAQLQSTVAALPSDAQKIWNSADAKLAWNAMIADGVKAAPYSLAAQKGETPTKEQSDAYNSAMAALQADTEALAVCFASGGSALTEGQINTFGTLAVTLGTLDYSQTLLDENTTSLANKKETALKQFSDAQQKLTDSKADIIDGQAELDKNKAKYETSIAEAKQKLLEAKDKVSDIKAAKWYVWDRSNNDSFSRLNNDVSFIRAITTAFPIIFFLVAILISLTTMTRMVEEDRGLIGTYKSLGYSSFKISIKYILYAALTCVFGAILGSLIGFVALPKVVGIIMSQMYVLPKFRLFIHTGYALGGFGLFLLGILGATAISCAEILHKRPAELMRPKVPKAGNRILLERIPFIWKRLSFLGKVTCRNLFRYKKRAIMTIVGILGCTMLIVLGFGIRDTVDGLMPDQFETVTVYDAIIATDDLSAKEMDTLSREWRATGMVKEDLQLQISSLTLHSENKSSDIIVMAIPDGADLGPYLHLYDYKTGKEMKLPSDGIVVTKNAAERLKLSGGNVVTLQNSDNLEYKFPVAFVASNYAGNYVFISESCYKSAFGDYAATAFLLNLQDGTEGQKWLDTLDSDKRILSVNSSQSRIDSFKDVGRIVDMVVYILIAMSAVLAFTVLFTLSNINISERERELSTIKVLGFQHKEVYSYVNKETLILTFIGILCGLPAGFGITYGILASVSIADVSFRVHVSTPAYFIAALLTLIFAVLVNKITNKGLRKINMVEALKSVE